MRTLALAATIAALSIAALAPTVQVTSDALIINTRISSSIIDAHGYAVAVAPVSCGIDSTVWCDVAGA